jgi:hypothetical protein
MGDEMLWMLEFLTSFYWPLLPQAILGTLRRANWRRAYARHGPAGLLLETAESMIGTNTFMFFVPLTGQWDGYTIAKLLRQYGIPMWGWGFWNQELFFHVRRDDVWFAQDVLLSAGVELLG